MFIGSLVGHYITGWNELNNELREHNESPIRAAQYIREGHFLQSLFENWESEFLQMGAYVLLTVFLFQKGSSDSKRPGVIERVDVIARSSKDDPEMPWPVRRGGLALAIYSHSLSIALFGLFALSFVLHALGGMMAHNSDARQHGEASVGLFEYIQTSRFWFESFQNWQSEFLSIGMMIVLAIFLRQKGSPESKPVDTPHADTGSD
jgi:hypothetical protein